MIRGVCISLGAVLGMALLAGAAAFRPAPTLDPGRIERLTGAKGTFDKKEGVFKVSAPRTDLHVVVSGVPIPPSMGLTSWAAFQKTGHQTMVMGDMVLLESQVDPVMDAALEAGLEVTALHNHFLGDVPKIVFMHIRGKGDEEKLAAAIGRVLARIRETAARPGEAPVVSNHRVRPSLNPQRIEAILGVKGMMADGVYRVVVPRVAQMDGHAIGSAMGVNTWAAFAGSDDRAVVTGDFAVFEDELQRVLRALRGARIHVTAIHNHMTTESPRVIFVHYWSVGPADDLARGVRAALEATGGKPGGANP